MPGRLGKGICLGGMVKKERAPLSGARRGFVQGAFEDRWLAGDNKLVLTQVFVETFQVTGNLSFTGGIKSFEVGYLLE